METLHLPLTDTATHPAGGMRRASCSCGWSSPWYPAGRGDPMVDLEAAYHQSIATGRDLPRPNGAIAALVYLITAVLVVLVVLVAVNYWVGVS